MLAVWPDLEQVTPMRIRTPTQVGDFEMVYLFSDWVEAQIWAGINKAEELTPSGTFSNGGPVNRANLPSVMFVSLRQPKADNEKDEECQGENWRGRGAVVAANRERGLLGPAPEGIWTLRPSVCLSRLARQR